MRFNSPSTIDGQQEQHLHAIISTADTRFDTIGSLADDNGITSALLGAKSIGHSEKELVVMMYLDSTETTAKQQLSDIIAWIAQHKTWLTHQGMTHWTLRGDTNIDLAKRAKSGLLDNQIAVIQQAKQLGTIHVAHHSNVEKKDAKDMVLSGSFGEPMPADAVVAMTILGTPKLDGTELNLADNPHYSRAGLDHVEMSHSDITALNMQPLPEHDIDIANLRAGKTLQDYREANLGLLATFTKSLQSVITLKRLFPPANRVRQIKTLLETASDSERADLEQEKNDFQTEIELVKTIMAYQGDIKASGKCIVAINTWCHHAHKYGLTDARMEAFEKAKRDLLHSDALRSVTQTVKLPIGNGSFTAVRDEIERRWADYVDMVVKDQAVHLDPDNKQDDNAGKCAIEAGKLFAALLFSSGSTRDPVPFKQRYKGQVDIGLDVNRGFAFPHYQNIVDATEQRRIMVANLLEADHTVLMTCEISTSALQTLCPDSHRILHAATPTQLLSNKTLIHGLLGGSEIQQAIIRFNTLLPATARLYTDGKRLTATLRHASDQTERVTHHSFAPKDLSLIFQRLTHLLDLLMADTRYKTQSKRLFQPVTKTFNEYLHSLDPDTHFDKIFALVNATLLASVIHNDPNYIGQVLRDSLLLSKHGGSKNSTLGTRIVQSDAFERCLRSLPDMDVSTLTYSSTSQ